MKTITHIVITGGPCAGKTSFMSHATKKLEAQGYGVLVVSESATELITAGCKPGVSVPLLEFQEIILATQIARESLYHTIAKRMSHEHIVILYDRGLMDNRAYIDDSDWQRLLTKTGHSQISLRDTRYDAVIHLRSAAIGAPDFYTQENNQARSESVCDARALDERTLNAWIGHSHVRVVGNEEGKSFVDKINQAYAYVLQILGKPIPLEIERRYLVSPLFDSTTIPTHYHSIAIEQMYIDGGFRLRKRTEDNVSTYSQTKKTKIDSSFACKEEETILSEEAYYSSAKYKLAGTRTIYKRRICFVYEGHYFELDIFEDTTSMRKLIILEIELTHENEAVKLPPWLPIVREITGEVRLSNRSLAEQ